MGQLSRAQDAACAVLAEDGARRIGALVQGWLGDVPISFLVDGNRWIVTASVEPLLVVGAIHARTRFARAFAHGRAFDRAFKVDDVDDGLAELLGDASLRARLVALGPHGVRVTTRSIVLEQRYAYYYAEEDDIRTAIELVADLARRARKCSDAVEERIRASVPAPSPYRGADPALADAAIAARLDELRRVERAPETTLGGRWQVGVGVALALTLAYALLH